MNGKVAYPPLTTGSPVGHEAALTVMVAPPTPTKAAVVAVVMIVDTVRV
jgi:hypothetical protein